MGKRFTPNSGGGRGMVDTGGEAVVICPEERDQGFVDHTISDLVPITSQTSLRNRCEERQYK